MRFEDFVKRGIVRKSSSKNIDVKRVVDSYKSRYNFLKSLPLREDYARYVIENCYDVIRELAEAILEKRGYKSYSHEATILYLKKLDKISDNEFIFIDNLRKIRNKIKYEREDQSVEGAKKVIEFVDKLIPKLLGAIK